MFQHVSVINAPGLALLVILGFGIRFTQLSAIGFAEDEMNKLDAVHSYERGDFSANSEHPMVMKMLVWASLRSGAGDSEEAALRLPNVLIGALTVIPLFLLTAALFDRWHALLAAAFWAFGINAITHNRIGKEDSLLVFFMLFAFFFFVRAKQLPPSDKPGRARRYAASAVSFGLMIASKYFPHYVGLNMLFHHNFHVRTATPGEPGGRTPGWFFLLIIGVYLFASPAVLLPQVWEYMDAYMGERLLTHSGYLFAGELYKNNMSSS
ncbi:MAG TPA: glycosyltransferase family 39 protein, partial [Pyrinomonadaceae bacterium]|nr:glycosyltransferase family 39 protein [Pyrinomonadaceae bacterium]